MNSKTYLQFNGNCEEAMNFYADVLGGEIIQKMKFSDAPEANLQFPKEMMDKVMHIVPYKLIIFSLWLLIM